MDGKLTQEIDLMKNGTYVVRDGELKEVPKPQSGYGKQVINWQGGKPCHGAVEEGFKLG